MTTLPRPPCTAQHPDQFNTLGCTGEHIGGYHVAEGTDGVVVRMWRDLDQPTSADLDRYDELLVALAPLVARLRGRGTYPDVQAVIAAYDRIVTPGTVAS